jgi:hypothetical protein
VEHDDNLYENDEGQEFNEIKLDLKENSNYLGISFSNEEWMPYLLVNLNCTM